jgi:hypothetical protein
MSRRNWSTFASLGGLILSLTWANPGVSQPASEGPHPIAEEKKSDGPPSVPSVILALKGDRSHCEGAKPHEDAATCYSRRSTEATERQSAEARISTKLGFVQAIGLLLSLVFTGWAALSAARATRIAQRAAADADKGLEISQKSADAAVMAAQAALRHADGIEKQLSVVERAYVFGGTVFTSTAGATFSHVDLPIIIKNHGKTPARVKSIKFGVFSPDAHGNYAYPNKPDYTGATMKKMDTIFSSGEGGTIINFRQQPLIGIIYGEIIYDDIFGFEHFSRFFFHYDAVNRLVNFSGDPEWNKFD